MTDDLSKTAQEVIPKARVQQISNRVINRIMLFIEESFVNKRISDRIISGVKIMKINFTKSLSCIRIIFFEIRIKSILANATVTVLLGQGNTV